MSAGDDPGQGFTLSEEVSKSNRVKTSTRGRGRLVPCCKVGRWVSCQEDPAGRKPFNADLVLNWNVNLSKISGTPHGIFSEKRGFSRSRENFDWKDNEREREGYVLGVPEVEDHEAGSLCGGKIEVVAEIVWEWRVWAPRTVNWLIERLLCSMGLFGRQTKKFLQTHSLEGKPAHRELTGGGKAKRTGKFACS